VNYRHAFHVGNHADVLKHLILVFCLDALKRKETPFAVLDTHAGRGLYDLNSSEAQRSPEWKDGIGRLMDWPDAPAPIARYLGAVRMSDGLYPGSPLIAAKALRATDRYAGCDLHPEEHDFLRQALATVRSEGKTQVHARDGWEALGALLPLPEKRGLILIDPPYEQLDDLEASVAGLQTALHRFRQGIYLWWRPLKSGSALDRADAELNISHLRADLFVDTPQPQGRLVGSSMLMINPPFGLEEALRETLPALAAKLAIGPGAGFKLTSR
jgi:23S rRNA (adenine2030-N6)-methyltransferase